MWHCIMRGDQPIASTLIVANVEHSLGPVNRPLLMAQCPASIMMEEFEDDFQKLSMEQDQHHIFVQQNVRQSNLL